MVFRVKGYTRYTKYWSAVWGLIIAVCGLAVVWGGNTGAPDTITILSSLSSLVEDVDASFPVPENDGKAIRAFANLEASESLEDEFLKPQFVLVLKREVEMFQWAEDFQPEDLSDEPKAVNPPLNGGYTLGWHRDQIDFFKFRVPVGHENPALTHESFVRLVKSPKFGGYNAKELLQYLSKAPEDRFFTPLELTPEILKEPGHEISRDRLYIRRNPGLIGDNLGDIRIRYKVLKPEEFTVVARQTETHNLSTGVVDGTPYFIVERGDASLSEMLKLDEQGSSRTKVTFMGGMLLFMGLLSLLIPFSASMDLRPTAELTGKAAAAAVSAVLSVALVLMTLMAAWIKG